MKQIVHEASLYGIASLCALCIDVGLLWILVKSLLDRRAEFAGIVASRLPALALNAGVFSMSVRYFGVAYLWARTPPR